MSALLANMFLSLSGLEDEKTLLPTCNHLVSHYMPYGYIPRIRSLLGRAFGLPAPRGLKYEQ